MPLPPAHSRMCARAMRRVEELLVPPEMKQRVRAYFYYQRATMDRESLREQLDMMSPALRGELTTFAFGAVLVRVPFLAIFGGLDHKQGIGSRVTSSLAMALRPEVFSPDDVITYIGTRPDKM